MLSLCGLTAGPRPGPPPPPWAGCHPHSAGWASARLTSACCGAAGSICCFTNRKVILRSCQHLSASIMRTHANTHRSASQPCTRARQDTHTLGSATHKAVNNRKWYVAEIVSVQLDWQTVLCSPTAALFSLSMLIRLLSSWLGWRFLLHLEAI